MSEAAMPPLELILRQCAAAAPQPWYPKDYAQQSGVARDSLDPPLDRLRLGGFVELTEWTQDHGQGYVLTRFGKDLLEHPRAMERVRQGDLPELRIAEPERVMQPEVEIEGEGLRAVIGSPRPFNPWMTKTILCINIAVFGYGLILALQAGVSIAGYLGMGVPIVVLLKQGAILGRNVYVDHEWWRLLTCAFVHIGLLHILVNMVSLWFIGPVLERLLGPGRYLLFYLLCAIGGSFGMLIDAPGTPTAGASGALWGLMAGLAVYVFANRRSLPPQVFQSWFRQLLGVILLNTVLTMQVSGISKGGHFGGGIAGALLVMPVDSLRLRRGAKAWIGMVVILAAMGVGFRYAYQSLERFSTSHENRLIRMNDEVDQFNNAFTNAIADQDRDAAKLAQDSLSELRAFENRDPEDVKKLRKSIEAQTAIMNDLKGQLTKAGPFLAENVEDARQTGVRLMTANIALLAKIDRCLQHQDRCDLEEEEREVQKERTHYGRLLKR
jgi:membrane associated rhomboid family serine protease